MTATHPANDFADAATTSEAVIAQTFATPVARIHNPHAKIMNRQLGELVLAKADAASRQYTYKTETLSDLVHWDNLVVRALTDWVLQMAKQLVQTLARRQRLDLPNFEVVVGSSWASIYRTGDQHEAHYHPNTALAAIYYVQAPTACELELLDPRAHVDYYDPGITFAGERHGVRLRCSPGELLLLPGWLKHAVPKFDEDGVRISISWNLSYKIG